MDESGSDSHVWLIRCSMLARAEGCPKLPISDKCLRLDQSANGAHTSGILLYSFRLTTIKTHAM